MDFNGLWLGDGTNYEKLQCLPKDFAIDYGQIAHDYRTVTGVRGKQTIRGPVPNISLSLEMVSDRIHGILSGARQSRTQLVLYFAKGGIKVLRQPEVMSSTTVAYLTKNSFSGLTVNKVYTQADFSGATNIFSSFTEADYSIVVNPAQTAGAPIYVDYTWTKVKVYCTALPLKPYRGSSRNYWQGSIKFEGA